MQNHQQRNDRRFFPRTFGLAAMSQIALAGAIVTSGCVEDGSEYTADDAAEYDGDEVVDRSDALDFETEEADASDIPGETAAIDEVLTVEELATEAVTTGCAKPLNTSFLKPYTLYWGAKTRRGTVFAAGKTREYLIELPANYNPNTPYPIVFEFHGQGAKMDNAYGMGVHKTWGGQVIAVYPQALPVNGKNSWQFTVGGGDQRFFEGMVTDLGSRLCIDMDRVFVQGTSRGGMMSNFVSCVRGDIVDGGGPAAGNFPVNSANCKGPVPQFIVHGTGDKTVSFNGGLATRDRWLAINGCTKTAKTFAPEPRCQIYSQCTSGKPVVWCAHSGGHVSSKFYGFDIDIKNFFRTF